MSAGAVGVLAPGAYWLTRFSTVSGVRNGRLPVVVLGAVPGERGRVYRVMLPHRAVSVADRKHLEPRHG